MRFILILLLCLSCQTAVLAPVYVQRDLTPTIAVQSVYRVMTSLDGNPAKSGTAWAVSEDVVITAGHVCSLTLQIEGFPIEIEVEGQKSFTLTSRDNKTWQAEQINWSQDPDLCALRILPAYEKLKPLPIAETMPEWGESLFYIGAPRGMWGDGVAMLFEGKYAGKDVVGVFTNPGASGSPIFTKKGVIGVLVATQLQAPSLTLMEPLKTLKPFVADSLRAP